MTNKTHITLGPEHNSVVIKVGQPYNSTVKVEYKLKDGTTIPVGTKVNIYFVENNSKTMFVENISDGQMYKLGIGNGYKHLSGFIKPPGIKAMENWADSGIAKSVLGHKVENDGIDEYNSPSWMMVLGII